MAGREREERDRFQVHIVKLFSESFLSFVKIFASLFSAKWNSCTHRLLSGEISMYLITNKGFIALQHLSFFSYFHCTFVWLSMFLFICDKARLNIKISKFLLMLNFFTFMYENLNFYIFQIIHSMYPCFLEANNTVTCVDIKL